MSSSTAKEIKELIFLKEGIGTSDQVIMFNDEKLDDCSFLSAYICRSRLSYEPEVEKNRKMVLPVLRKMSRAVVY